MLLLKCETTFCKSQYFFSVLITIHFFYHPNNMLPHYLFPYSILFYSPHVYFNKHLIDQDENAKY